MHNGQMKRKQRVAASFISEGISPVEDLSSAVLCLIPIRIQVDIFTGKPFLLLPLRAPYPAINSPALNSRTRSAAQTARIGLNAAWPQARYGSLAGSQGVLDVRKRKQFPLFCKLLFW
jgi:hypothetical protein